MKPPFKALLAFAAVAGLGGGLYLLRAEPAAAAVPAPPAAAAAVVAAPAGAPAAAAPAAPVASATALPDIPAFASEAERQGTQAVRREALPAFLAVADRSIAQLEDEIAALQRRGAAQSEIQARRDRIGAMSALRARVLARNADIAVPR